MNPCDACAACCQYVNEFIRAPKEVSALDEIIWYLLHGVRILVDQDGDWSAEVPRPCLKLTPEGWCGIYDERPLMCRNYSPNECERHIDKYKYMFNNLEEFMNFVKNDTELLVLYNQRKEMM